MSLVNGFDALFLQTEFPQEQGVYPRLVTKLKSQVPSGA